jgi:hypothetical protein
MEQRQDDYIMGPRGSNGANGNEIHMNQGYSGERCGPWASCFYVALYVKILSVNHIKNMITLVY